MKKPWCFQSLEVGQKVWEDLGKNGWKSRQQMCDTETLSNKKGRYFKRDINCMEFSCDFEQQGEKIVYLFGMMEI